MYAHYKLVALSRVRVIVRVYNSHVKVDIASDHYCTY